MDPGKVVVSAPDSVAGVAGVDCSSSGVNAFTTVVRGGSAALSEHPPSRPTQLHAVNSAVATAARGYFAVDRDTGTSDLSNQFDPLL